MSKRRYLRVLDKVREEVTLEKAKGIYPYLRPRDLAEKLNVKESVINQACSVLQKEGVLSPWRGSRGTYSINTPPPSPDPFANFRPTAKGPRKQKVSWGSKRRVLALIRKTKPWVVECWYETDQRWFMYIEAPDHYDHDGKIEPPGILAADQPDLTRTQIAKWHFDMDGAIKACAEVRRRHSKWTFRTRDTSAGDYLMGAIL